MAIEREIPKDIDKYEAKLLGPFTTRQTICIVPAAISAIGTVLLLKDFVPQDVYFVVALFLAAPWLLCGWVKMGGLPFEKFLQTVFISIVLAPKHRVYKTVNMHEKALSAQDVVVPEKQKKAAAKAAQKYISKDPRLKAYK